MLSFAVAPSFQPLRDCVFPQNERAENRKSGSQPIRGYEFGYSIRGCEFSQSLIIFKRSPSVRLGSNFISLRQADFRPAHASQRERSRPYDHPAKDLRLTLTTLYCVKYKKSSIIFFRFKISHSSDLNPYILPTEN